MSKMSLSLSYNVSKNRQYMLFKKVSKMLKNIKGSTIPSLVDWDGEVCATLFLGGCNLKCKFCQNTPLVVNPQKLKNINTDELLLNIERFSNYLTGVCITGGEPLLNCLDLEPLLKNIKAMKLKVKLDTNGFFPDYFKHYLDLNLIDYVAMDVKAPLVLKKYSSLCGRRFKLDDLNLVQNSIDIIRGSGKGYEFRTTVIPKFHTVKDIEDISKYAIKGANRYIIQNFRTCNTLMSPKKCPPNGFSLPQLEKFAKVAYPHVKEVRIRNCDQNL
jgi:pyruvate formate lyase activating enzyme